MTRKKRIEEAIKKLEELSHYAQEYRKAQCELFDAVASFDVGDKVMVMDGLSTKFEGTVIKIDNDLYAVRKDGKENIIEYRHQRYLRRIR